MAWLRQAEPGQEDLTVYDVAMLDRLPHQAVWLEWIRCLTEEGTSVISVLHELNLALQADRLWDTHNALSQVFENRLHWQQIVDKDTKDCWIVTLR